MTLYTLPALLFVLLLLLYLVVEYGFMVPAVKGLPILMYHKVSENEADGLTVKIQDLENQFAFIRNSGYTSIAFEELAQTGAHQDKGEKRIILTFDDAYESFYEHVFPLLEQYQLKATLFVPVGFIGKTNAWDKGSDKILETDKLRKLSESGRVELGIHSYFHKNYKDLSPEEMKNDLTSCFKGMEKLDLPYSKVLAYPYGGFPKKNPALNGKMKEIFRECGLLFALRIGNRINKLPLKDRYQVKRIDIKGTDGFYTFKTKLKKGRQKLFA